MIDFSNILIADDSEDDFLFLSDALHSIVPTLNIRRAKDGLDCLRVLKESETPNLLFLDLEMPYIKGLECLKYIKSNTRFAHIPVVMNSTSFYMKFIDVAFKEGAQHYMVKPCRFSETKALLEILFERLSWTQERAKQNFVLKQSNILREQYV
jgi:PleD family two-component response regulator